MPNFVHDGSFIPDGPLKDEDSIIDYGCDWADWLQAGEIITGSSWSTTPSSGITKGAEDFTTTATSIFLSDGNEGVVYRLSNRITTNQGRTEDRSMVITVAEK